MEPKCENCYYFLDMTDTNNAEHEYYCLGDNYPYATPADIKGCRFWDKNACFKEQEDKNDRTSMPEMLLHDACRLDTKSI